MQVATPRVEIERRTPLERQSATPAPTPAPPPRRDVVERVVQARVPAVAPSVHVERREFVHVEARPREREARPGRARAAEREPVRRSLPEPSDVPLRAPTRPLEPRATSVRELETHTRVVELERRSSEARAPRAREREPSRPSGARVEGVPAPQQVATPSRPQREDPASEARPQVSRVAMPQRQDQRAATASVREREVAEPTPRRGEDRPAPVVAARTPAQPPVQPPVQPALRPEPQPQPQPSPAIAPSKAASPSPASAAGSSADESVVVRVSIGRIEIRATGSERERRARGSSARSHAIPIDHDPKGGG